mmetsp:Transcript_4109/g.9851  ORF Transcript_4109/g.9851 Transcript_4109/m.9851 type:complete len:227 (+) Transcript_4109:571-1251(+)
MGISRLLRQVSVIGVLPPQVLERLPVVVLHQLLPQLQRLRLVRRARTVRHSPCPGLHQMRKAILRMWAQTTTQRTRLRVENESMMILMLSNCGDRHGPPTLQIGPLPPRPRRIWTRPTRMATPPVGCFLPRKVRKGSQMIRTRTSQKDSAYSPQPRVRRQTAFSEQVSWASAEELPGSLVCGLMLRAQLRRHKHPCSCQSPLLTIFNQPPSTITRPRSLPCIAAAG